MTDARIVSWTFRGDPYSYPMPALQDIRNKPRSSEYPEGYNSCIDDLTHLMVYMLDRLGFPLESFEAFSNEEPFPTGFAQSAESPDRVFELASSAWENLDSYLPMDALDDIFWVLHELHMEAPLWWLEQIESVPECERDDLPFRVDRWMTKFVPIDKGELPPWEPSQIVE